MGLVDDLNEHVLFAWDVEKTLTVNTEAHVQCVNEAWTEVIDSRLPFLIVPGRGVYLALEAEDNGLENIAPLDGSLVTEILDAAHEYLVSRGDALRLTSHERATKFGAVLASAADRWAQMVPAALGHPTHPMKAIDGVIDFIKYTRDFPRVKHVVVTGSPESIALTNLEATGLRSAFPVGLKVCGGNQGLDPKITDRSALLELAIRFVRRTTQNSALKPIYFDDSPRALANAVSISVPTVGVTQGYDDIAGQAEKLSPLAGLVISSYRPAPELFELVMQYAARGFADPAGIGTAFYGPELTPSRGPGLGRTIS